jgi:hypothetical protein
MRMRISSRLLAWAVTQLLLAAGPNLANTVDIVQDGFGPYDRATVRGGGCEGDGVAAGVYTLNKTGDSGIGRTWHNGLIAGFCVELNEAAPTETLRVFTNCGAQNCLVAVPEPAPPALLGFGGLALIRRRRTYN